MDYNQYLQAAQPYISSTINAIMPYVGTTPTPFEQINPFSNYFNQAQDQAAVQEQFDPYYQKILQNYYNLTGLRNQQYLNQYTTDKNYLNQSQQNYLNYQGGRLNYMNQQLQGGFQGKGVGSSSAAQDAGNLQTNDSNYQLQQQALDTQHSLQAAQNQFNSSTAQNNADYNQYAFGQGQQEQKDIAGQVSQDQANAIQQYNAMKNDYYNNFNYSAATQGAKPF